LREIPKGTEIWGSVLENVALENMYEAGNWLQASALEKPVLGKTDGLDEILKQGAFYFLQILAVFQVLTWLCKIFRVSTIDSTDGNALGS
jgi:hypothetical protein